MYSSYNNLKNNINVYSKSNLKINDNLYSKSNLYNKSNLKSNDNFYNKSNLKINDKCILKNSNNSIKKSNLKIDNYCNIESSNKSNYKIKDYCSLENINKNILKSNDNKINLKSDEENNMEIELIRNCREKENIKNEIKIIEKENRTMNNVVRFDDKIIDMYPKLNETILKNKFDLCAYNENLNIDEKYVIVYDRMGGRPSLKIKINGHWKNCLLDTGARINVIDNNVISTWKNVKRKLGNDKVSCANGSPLQTKGRVILEVEIDRVIKEIEFIVAEGLSPEIIGGIEFLNQFGIKLCKTTQNSLIESGDSLNYTELCSIEAKYGSCVNDESRFLKAIEILKLDKNSDLYNIIERNKTIFMINKWDIGKTNWIKHSIDTNEGPILVKPRRQPMHLETKIEEALKNLEENGIIRRCDSQWNAPLVCVWKKEKNDIRLCLDFRCLNKITERHAFPMPNIDEMLDILNGSQYFSTIDLGSAYYQVELEEESKKKTAFSTRTGQYCFNRMPFGIAAAPATFQKLMTMVLGDLNWKEAVVYLDDILIFAKDKIEHVKRIEKVLSRIKEAGLKVNPEKCIFMKTETKFLGHIINADGIQTDKEKLEAIKNFDRPKCIKNLRSFLGICNYYRKFIKNYAKYSRTLEAMCGNNKDKLIWSDECEDAFIQLKGALSVTPVLIYPNFRKEFILDTDASFDTIGAVLSQKDDQGNERVIAYGSHTMNKHELGYCITRKELLAIYYFTQHFKHYLYGKKFTLRTDHKAITFMIATKKPITAQFQTWINFLSSLDMNILYRKGSEHANADAMSRDKCGRCTQCLMEHEEPKVEKIKTRLLAME